MLGFRNCAGYPIDDCSKHQIRVSPFLAQALPETAVDTEKAEGEHPPQEEDNAVPMEESMFPEVPQEGYVTRRAQFGAKQALHEADGRRGRGGRGRGRGRATAAKSMAKEKKEPEGRNSSSSNGPVEKGSELRRMKRHVAAEDGDKDETGDDSPASREDSADTKQPKPKAGAKGKAKAKAKALPKGKAKAKAKGKCKAKSSPGADDPGNDDDDDDAGEPPSKKAKLDVEPRSKKPKSAKHNDDVEPASKKPKLGVEPVSKKAKSASRPEALETAFKNTFHRLTQQRKPEPLVFRDMNADALLSNPDHIRNVLKYEIMKCLIQCYTAGEADKKGKHNHLEKMIAPANYRYELCWTRSSVGVKRQEGDEMKQIVYFSRPTTCTGTNRILAHYFVGGPGWFLEWCV